MGETAALAMSWEMLPSAGEMASNPNPAGLDLKALGTQFSSLLSSPEGIVPPEASSSTALFDFPRPQSLGNMIVTKLDAVGMEFKSNMERAHSTFEQSPQDITLVSALKAQYEMAVVTLQIDVVGKGVQKSVQNIETFLKMQ